MKIVEPSVEIVAITENPDEVIERAARTCYQSSVKEESRDAFLRSVINRGHESVLEHASVTFKIVTDRGTSHQFVRHRIASYSQESTRYCNYSDDKFGDEISVIIPYAIRENLEVVAGYEELQEYRLWKDTIAWCESSYRTMVGKCGMKPEVARSILPTCLKTSFLVTMNFRSLRNFFKLRLDSHAQADIREIARMMLDRIHERVKTVCFEGF